MGEDPRSAEPAPRGLRRRRSRLVRLGLLTLGWSLVALGVVGGLLPGIQGWILGVPGFAIVYLESRWVQRALRRWRQKSPRLERGWLKARAWLKARRRRGPGVPRERQSI